VGTAVKRQAGKKAYKTMELIGCTIEHLKQYLERQFVLGMNWDNWGEWHIDHKIPCATFDLTNTDEQRRCFHYTNLQPLWAIDNFVKNDRLDWHPKQKRVARALAKLTFPEHRT
jgi:hypothetical protein